MSPTPLHPKRANSRSCPPNLQSPGTPGELWGCKMLPVSWDRLLEDPSFKTTSTSKVPVDLELMASPV